MSKKRRFDSANPPISELAQRAQPQETTMEAPTADVTATVTTDPIDAAFSAIEDQVGEKAPEAPAENQEPSVTAKAMAHAEEVNAARMKALTEQRQQEPAPEPPLIEVAAQGIDALHEALRQHGNRPVPEYVPPARTERQMKSLEEELEAGRRASERAKEQDRIAKEYRAQSAAKDRANQQHARRTEEFTTPVYRPSDTVPNPLGGMGTFNKEG